MKTRKIKEVEHGAVWYDIYDDTKYLRYVIIGFKVKKYLRTIDNYPDELTEDQFNEIFYVFKKLIAQMKCARFSYNPYTYKWYGITQIAKPFHNIVTSSHICFLASLKFLSKNLLAGIENLKSIPDPAEREDKYKIILDAMSFIVESGPVRGKELSYRQYKRVYVFLSRPSQEHIDEINGYPVKPKTGEEFDELDGKYFKFIACGAAIYVIKNHDTSKWVADYTFPEPINRSMHAFGNSLDDVIINLRDKMKQKAFD